ncbi:three-helix bundle dimerization domain-containing protein [Mycobacterium scrofulaceum]|uniref:three-helix bundle dimerization domain-containing protein n=1 Tax=Mycobacterium scrofulaceum TaxID=1783 RepID=UPI002F91BCB6
MIDEFPYIPSEVVDAVIREEHARFTHSRVRDFVPLFVEKHTREQLKARSN